MVPPGHFLLIRADVPFRARILNNERIAGVEESLYQANGTCFALFNPMTVPAKQTALTLKLAIYTPERCQHVDAPLLLLTRAENVRFNNSFKRSRLLDQTLLMLGTNGRGGMFRAHAGWGELTSRYDALLAANLHPDLPEDRRVLLSRCRAWLVFQDYSQELNHLCQESFHFDDRQGYWRFRVPTGQGEHVVITINAGMTPGENTVKMSFFRHPGEAGNKRLDDDSPVKLILRPDIEDRSFHETTKAYLGLEELWPKSVTTGSNGFAFTPGSKRCLQIQISRGSFVPEPEWQYMVHRSMEKERGLDPDSDLFSPGYFSVELRGGQRVELTSRVSESTHDPLPAPRPPDPDREKTGPGGTEKQKPLEALEKALDHYIVKRGALKSIVAGYPWFLDWGRDAIIVVRGIIAAGRTGDARDILKQFGRFEMNGTLVQRSDCP